jgi:hypothetical protein
MMHLHTPTYDPANPAPVCSTRFLSIHPAVNHKSQTQLNVWQTLVQDYYAVFNASHLGIQSLADADEFPTRVTGMMTDHAPDQYSLSDGFEDWRALCDRRLCGKEAMLSMSLIELLPIISDVCDQKFAAVWGMEKWVCSLMKKRQREMLLHMRILLSA